MRRLFILWHIILFPLWAYSQICGLTDTFLIRPDTAFAIPITIQPDDLVNTDLSDPQQGLCGIELEFQHNFIEDLELTLVSPDGHQIQLIGPNTDDQVAFTIGSRWRISFVPSTEAAEPDVGYTARWNNDQARNFVSGFLYTGSYYPHNGNLEEFNLGTVFGTWELRITNAPSFYAGRILAVKLIFCDETGLDCCFADAGELLNDDYTFPRMEGSDGARCIGDDSLLIEPEVDYADNPPDSREYGYTYLISRDSEVIAIDTVVDLRAYPAGSYQICGLSYLLSDSLLLPMPDGTLTLDSLYRDLDRIDRSFCGHLTPDCIDIVIEDPPVPVTETARICEGESYVFLNNTYTQPGTYPHVLTTAAGCDSLVNLILQVETESTTFLDTTICDGSSIQIGEREYDTEGTYRDTLQSALGCDSIVVLNLVVENAGFALVNRAICSGDSVTVAGMTFKEEGSYRIFVPTPRKCDSIVMLNLSLLEAQIRIATPDTLNCARSTVMLDASASTPAGRLRFLWQNQQGDTLGTEAMLAVADPGWYFLSVTQDSFGMSCTQYDSIQVIANRQIPVADAGPAQTLTCDRSAVRLGGNAGSNGPEFRYTWTSSRGRFIGPTDIQNPLVDAPGEYQLVVINTENACRDSAIVRIQADQSIPVLPVLSDTTLTCTRSSLSLSNTGASTGNDFTQAWRTVDGNVLSTQPTLMLTTPGDYEYYIINTRNGCADSIRFAVTVDTLAPVALIDTSDPLDCATPSLRLNATASTLDIDTEISWEAAAGGQVLEDNASLTPLIGSAGRYTLQLINQRNGCRDAASILVTDRSVTLLAEPVQPDRLTCTTTSIVLEIGASSTGEHIQYQWTTTNGRFADGTLTTQGPTAEATASGTYELQVRDTLTHCMATADIEVVSDTAPPIVDAGQDQELNCSNELVDLDASGSFNEAGTQYNWSGPCLLGRTDSIGALANCPGEYILTVTRPDNGCTATDTVFVLLGPTAPVAVLPDTARINCAQGTALLDGSASSEGTYSWRRNGQPIAQATDNTLSATDVGLYELIVARQGGSCISRDSIVVVGDCQPEIVIAPPQEINCNRSSIVLDATSSRGQSLVYEWTPPDASCIVAGQGTPRLEVSCGGAYTLILTNSSVQLRDTQTIIVDIDDTLPIAVAGPPDTLNCVRTTATLDGSASSSGPNIVYTWTRVASGDTIARTALAGTADAGTYLLEVLDTLTGCRATASVRIVQFNLMPTITFGDATFPCGQDTFALNAMVRPLSDFYQYQWSGPHLAGPSDGSTVLVDSIGEYTLQVTDRRSACQASASITLLEDGSCGPCLEVDPPAELSCEEPMVTLQADFCRTCIGCTLQWTTADGLIVSGANTLTPSVGRPGTYRLTSTDTLGITASLEVLVVSRANVPPRGGGPDRLLNCDSLSVAIGRSDLTPQDNWTFNWTSVEDSSFGPFSGPMIRVDAPGQYLLEILNNDNGCFTLDTVSVQYDTLAPLADAGPDQVLGCEQSFAVLDGTASSGGNQYVYQWTTGAGDDCLQGINSVKPIAGCPGDYFLQVRNLNNGCTAEDSVNVSQSSSQPILSPISDQVLTCDQPEAVLSVALPDSTAYTYRWCRLDNAGQKTDCRNVQQLTVSQAGDYLFVLTDNANACQDSVSVQVSDQREVPLADAGPDRLFSCVDDSLLLQASIGPDLARLEVMWQSTSNQFIRDAASMRPTVYGADTLVLTVTDIQSGCQAQDTVIIGQDAAAPIIIVGPDTSLTCRQPTLRLQAMATSAAGGMLTYQWEATEGGNIQAGEQTATPLINQPGHYILTVTDAANACTASAGVVVADLRFPPSAIVTDPDNLSLDCYGDSLLLDAGLSQAFTDAALTYDWSAISGGELIGDLSAATVKTDVVGTYRLVVTDTGNGCRDTLQFNVTADFAAPVIRVASVETITCDQPSVTLDATDSGPANGYLVQWTDEAGMVLSEEGLLLPVDSPGTYYLQITDPGNGCSSLSEPLVVGIDTLSLTVRIEPPALLDCDAQQVTLLAQTDPANNDLTYQWSTEDGVLVGDSTGVIAFAAAPGNYGVMVTQLSNGCKATATAQVEAITIPISGIQIEVFAPDCIDAASGSVQILDVQGGTPPFMYSLNDGQSVSSGTFTGLSPGPYSLTIRDINGCEWSEEFVIPDITTFTIELGPDMVIESGDSVTVEVQTSSADVLTYTWDPPLSDGPILQIQPTTSTSYSVTVTDSRGCRAEDRLRVQVRQTRPYYIPTAFSPDGDGHNDRFTVLSGPGVVRINTLRIYNRWGHQVFFRDDLTPSDPLQGWDGQSGGQPMGPGVYVYYAVLEYADGRLESVQGEVTLLR